jgi:hypothetical protein
VDPAEGGVNNSETCSSNVRLSVCDKGAPVGVMNLIDILIFMTHILKQIHN